MIIIEYFTFFHFVVNRVGETEDFGFLHLSGMSETTVFCLSDYVKGTLFCVFAIVEVFVWENVGVTTTDFVLSSVISFTYG